MDDYSKLNEASLKRKLENAVDLDERRQIRTALRVLRNSSTVNSAVSNARRRKSSVVQSPVHGANNRRVSLTFNQNNNNSKRDFIAENKEKASRRDSVVGARKTSVGQAAGKRRPSTVAGNTGRRDSSVAKSPGIRRESVANNSRKQSVPKKQVSEVKLFLKAPNAGQQNRKSPTRTASPPPRSPSVSNNASPRRLSVANGNKRKASITGVGNAGRRPSTVQNANRRASKVGMDRRKSVSIHDIDKIQDADVLRQMLSDSTKAEERVRIQKAIKAVDPQHGHSLPCTSPNRRPSSTLTANKFNVRKSSISKKPDYSTITDERELENLLNETKDYFEKKKIRSALTEQRKRNIKKSTDVKCKTHASSAAVEAATAQTSSLDVHLNNGEGLEEGASADRGIRQRRSGVFAPIAITITEPPEEEGKMPADDHVTVIAVDPSNGNHGNGNAEENFVNNLKQQIKDLEHKLDQSKDFDCRRQIRAKIRDLRAGLREGYFTGQDSQPATPQKSRSLWDPSRGMDLPSPTSPTPLPTTPESEEMEVMTAEHETPLQNGSRQTRIAMFKTRTPSQSDIVEKDTIVETTLVTPSGDTHVEQSQLTTRTKVTRHGSQYVRRDAVRKRTVADHEGKEIAQDTDILVEKDSMSVTRRESSCETVKLRLVDEPDIALERPSQQDDVVDDEEYPEVVDALEDVSVPDGESTTLTCRMKGASDKDDCRVTWYKGDKEIESTKEFNQTFDGTVAELRIAEVFPDDQGAYRCVLLTDNGMAETAAYLTVIENQSSEIPGFSMTQDNVEVTNGQDAVFECHVCGKPVPTATWYRGPRPIIFNQDFIQSFDGTVAKLTIRQVYCDDSGTYSLLLKNAAGEARCQWQMNVYKTVAPKFTVHLENQTVFEGRPVTLSCQVTGNPPPKISWHLDDHPLPNGAEFKQEFDGCTSTLHLDEAFEDDEGEFKCIATNLGGQADTKMVLVVGEDKPKAPVFTHQLEDAQGLDGQSLQLECTVEANPEPIIIWYRDHKILRAGTEYKQTLEGDKAKLFVREVFPDDAGFYECVARNDQGKSSTSCHVSVKDKSGHIHQDISLKQAKSMSSIDTIEDEDVLHKMLSGTENFDERKKIRARMREVREKKAAEFEAKRVARDSNKEDAVALRQRMAKEEKERKMAAYNAEAKKGKQDVGTAEKHRQERLAESEKEKQKKIEHFNEMAATQAASYHAVGDTIRKAEQAASDKMKDRRLDGFQATSTSTKTEQGAGGGTTTTTTTTQNSKDGSTTVTQQTKQVSQTSGIGGTSYRISKTTAEEAAKSLADTFSNKAAHGTSGLINVRTESWNSTNGVTKRTEKSQAWGAKASPRGAANMFKSMDKANAPAGTPTKPNYLSTPANAGGAAAGRGGGGRVGVQRSPSAIKQMLLDWCKSVTTGYEHVNVTNYSSSWNNGMAFCALIHHYYPDAFDFSKLDPKNRESNFQLAFDTAEKEADISPLLDVEDMVRMKNPDWKCVFCYVQTLYRGLRSIEMKREAQAQKEQ